MGFDSLLSSMNISASGLSAERLRMEVVANNIANAHSTRTSTGQPFRRQEVLFSSVMDEFQARSRGTGMGGVQVMGIVEDQSELEKMRDPDHPHADAEGFVTLPNVKLPNEMIDLITASRAYDANLRALRTYRQMAEQALTILQRIS